MNSLFVKLTSNFKVELNLEEMFLQFGPEFICEPSDGKGYVTKSKDHRVFWQTYLNGTAFARDFSFTFPNEAKKITDQIRALQNQVFESDSPLIKTFKAATIFPVDLMLLRINQDARVHIDGKRAIALNIGLRNSNTKETVISEDTNIENFQESKLHSFTMEDGDAYLINTRHPHAVNSIVKENYNNPRYIITHTIA
jgi:hypothetical protein